MTHRLWMPAVLLCLASVPVCAPTAENDSERRVAAPAAELPQLDKTQLQAVGIRVAHPVAARGPDQIEGIGVALDPVSLLIESGDAMAAEAAERSASAEVGRLQELYSSGAGASLKTLEAARSERARLQAQAQGASARFALHWGPLAALPQAALQKTIANARTGQIVLVRADLPGRRSLAAVPRDAVLDVDGLQVHAKVLGILREATDVQGVGLLLEVVGPPPGFGPGARVSLALFAGDSNGMLIPRDAVIYDENGAYVYKQLDDKQPNGGKTRFAPVKVRLVAPLADGWLTEGLDDDDNIVVLGAGVLWSLQGVGIHAGDNDEDED